MNFMQQMFGRPDTHLSQLLPLLEEKGVALLAAQYAGGNDEGGVEDITLYADLAKSDEGVTGKQPLEYDGGYQDPIWDLCGQILSTQYGSWAGDWSASGTLYVDVAAKHCWKSGQMQVWADDDDPLDFRL